MEISFSLKYKQYNKSQNMKPTPDMKIQYMRWKDGSRWRALAAFSEVLSSIPSTSMVAHNHLLSQPSDALFWRKAHMQIEHPYIK